MGRFYSEEVVLSWGGRLLGWAGSRGRRAAREPAGWLTGPVVPEHLQLVRQEMAVCPEQLVEFLDSLRQYLRGTAGARNCFQ